LFDGTLRIRIPALMAVILEHAAQDAAIEAVVIDAEN
jgi:hypothetical protein